MTYNEINEIIRSLKSQLEELESMIDEPNGVFCKSRITTMFKNHTSTARANAIIPLYKAVKEVAEKVKGLDTMISEFPSNSHFIELRRKFAYCGQHLISVINMIEEWGV